MIKLKNILFELKDLDIRRLLSKINNNEYRFFDQGDNGRVYEIDGEDKLFKITNESDEFDVATVIVGRGSEFSTFIPIYYVDAGKQFMQRCQIAVVLIQPEHTSPAIAVKRL